MKTKLTLRIDEQLITKAKLAAQHHGVSVSEMVARWFSALPEPQSEEDWQQHLSPQLYHLIGILNPDGTNPPITDELLEAQYRAYLEEKYH